MKLIQIYANYGVLTREKTVVYSFGGENATALRSETLYVEIPDDFKIGRNYMGELLITPPDSEFNWTINQLLSKHGENVSFRWIDKNGRQRYKVLRTDVNPSADDIILNEY
ncbi:hypothetical protein ACDL92_11860 [Ihubacter sp. mB4P-1]|uniref:hypothetical protein n=1 Tax=Ihubacter sp. mB4P-1 TaxID=3242370 RepID=UPI002172682C|nr:hypothetical protein [Emergencia sp.]